MLSYNPHEVSKCAMDILSCTANDVVSRMTLQRTNAFERGVMSVGIDTKSI